MRRVQLYYDEPRDVSEEEYLFLIDRLAGAMHSEALMLIMDLSRGIPNPREIATPEMFENHMSLTRAISDISDQQLHSLFRALADHSAQLWELEHELLEMVAHYYDLKTPLSSSERKRLHKKLNQHWVKPVTSDWRGTRRYQEIANAVEDMDPQVARIKEQIDERLRVLNAQLNSRS